MVKKMILDVDGVLLNFIQAFEEVAHSMSKELGIDIKIAEDKYHLTGRLGITQEQENEIWKKFAETGKWANLNPLPGVIEAIDAINKAGWEVYIVTAIEPEFAEQRLSNLKHLGLVPKEIHCVGYGNDKQKIIDEIDPDVFVDDRLEHLHRAKKAYHLVWIQDSVEQFNLKEDSGVDVASVSLLDWTKNHMPQVIQELEDSAKNKVPLQRKLRFF